MDNKDKVALITGGSAGVGLSLARKYLQDEMKVIIVGRNQDRLDLACKGLKESKKGELLAFRGDVSKEKSVKDIFNKVIDKYKKIDILVNCAGIALVKKIRSTSLSDWNEIFAINSTGVFLMSREVINIMIQNKIPGKIVNVSSISAKTGAALATAYTASKAAVIGFTKSLAKEVAPYKINVNCVCPGAIDTDMFQKGSIDSLAHMFKMDREALIKSTLSVIPLKRLLGSSEVADMIYYLSSNKASGITGRAFDIACGYPA